jgi:hypothetical protein
MLAHKTWPPTSAGVILTEGAEPSNRLTQVGYSSPAQPPTVHDRRYSGVRADTKRYWADQELDSIIILRKHDDDDDDDATN